MIDYGKFEKSLKHLEAQLHNYQSIAGRLELAEIDKEILLSLLTRYLPNTTVWAYGSRVSQDVQPWSDLDMVVFTKDDQKIRLSLLREALEESNLPFRVDLHEWNILPDNFKANIENSHVTIQ